MITALMFENADLVTNDEGQSVTDFFVYKYHPFTHEYLYRNHAMVFSLEATISMHKLHEFLNDVLDEYRQSKNNDSTVLSIYLIGYENGQIVQKSTKLTPDFVNGYAKYDVRKWADENGLKNIPFPETISNDVAERMFKYAEELYNTTINLTNIPSNMHYIFEDANTLVQDTDMVRIESLDARAKKLETYNGALYPGLTAAAVHWIKYAYHKKYHVNQNAVNETIEKLESIKKPSRY